MKLSKSTKLALQTFMEGVKADTGIKFNNIDMWNHDGRDVLDPSDFKEFEVRKVGSDYQLKGESYVQGVRIEAYKYFTPEKGNVQ